MKRVILGIVALASPVAGLFAFSAGNTVYGCYLFVLGLASAAILVRMLLGYNRMDGLFLQGIAFTLLFAGGTVWFGVDLLGRVIGIRSRDGVQIGGDLLMLVVMVPFGIACGISVFRLSHGQDVRGTPVGPASDTTAE